MEKSWRQHWIIYISKLCSEEAPYTVYLPNHQELEFEYPPKGTDNQSIVEKWQESIRKELYHLTVK